MNSLCTAAVVMAWTAVFVGLLFLILKLLNLLKVSKEEELRGKNIELKLIEERINLMHRY